MSGADRDLVAGLRAELAAVDPARTCDRRAETAGLGSRLITREPTVARLALRLGGTTIPLNPGSLRHAFRLPDPPFEWSRSAEHCRLAWLRGHFLARGSLSLAGGRAHLEFVVPVAEAPVLAARLGDLGLPAGWRVRRGLGVVTWKSTESIAAFLGRIGASASLLELEARSVARSLRGDLNRVLNAESANLQRSVAAAGRQLAAIDALEADGRLGTQPPVVRAVAEARRDTPEASLSEIAGRLDLHRSAVQRALDRLEQLVLHDDDGIGRRYRTTGGGDAAKGSGVLRRRAIGPRNRGRATAPGRSTGRGSRRSPLA